MFSTLYCVPFISWEQDRSSLAGIENSGDNRLRFYDGQGDASAFLSAAQTLALARAVANGSANDRDDVQVRPRNWFANLRELLIAAGAGAPSGFTYTNPASGSPGGSFSIGAQTFAVGTVDGFIKTILELSGNQTAITYMMRGNTS